MIIQLSNEYGIFEIGGGTHPNANLQEITGLGLVSKETEEVSYSGMDGAVILNERCSSRTMTLKFDYYGDRKLITTFFKILQKPVKFVLLDENQYYREIECRVISDVENVTIIPHRWHELTLQLTAPEPWFKSELKRINIRRFVNHFPNVSENDSWYVQLPATATSTIDHAEADNDGDDKIYPIINITNTAEVTGEANDYIAVKINDSTAKIMYHMAKDEQITFNFPERKIISSVHGNITKKITNDTILSNMYLDVGRSVISVESSKAADVLSCTAEYQIKYGMAVI